MRIYFALKTKLLLAHSSRLTGSHLDREYLPITLADIGAVLRRIYNRSCGEQVRPARWEATKRAGHRIPLHMKSPLHRVGIRDLEGGRAGHRNGTMGGAWGLRGGWRGVGGLGEVDISF